MKPVNSKQKVYVVDDSLTVLTNIMLLLKDIYEVSLFKSGLDMLDFINKNPNSLPDIVLLDVMMPDCSGYDIIKELKKNDILAPIPVIFLTAKSEEEDEMMGLELGAVDYITKPFHPSILKARIKTHLANKNFQDMLKIKNAELKNYSELLKRYLEIIELAPVSILITDKNNKTIFVNKHYVDISGYSKEEILGKDPGFIKSGKTSVTVYSSLWEKLNKKQMWEGVFINKKKNGELYYEETRVLPILNESGDIEYYVAAKLDITEKLKLQEKEAMLTKAKSLINLSGGIAHHLNNINTPLLIIAEHLANKLKDEPEYKKMLNIMMDSVCRATNLINSIRTYSKNSIMSMKIINFNTFLKTIIEISKNISKDNIQLSTNIESIEGVKVSVDVDMMERAIMNVVENSIEAMPHGGKITINSFLINKNSKQYIVLEIQDTGIGIPNNIKAEVFEPFFTTKSYKNAKGLGLSETLGIIEQHNGFIELESEENHGTTVRIYLPTYS